MKASADEETELPTALRQILVKVRKDLKEAGDDGKGDGPHTYTKVNFGWREVRAVYALHVALNEARFAREKFKKESRRANKEVERLKKGGLDRPTRKLLAEVERVLSGEEDSERALHSVLESVREALGR